MRARAPSPFPWKEAMALGLGVLRHAPHDFWEMTPRELIAARDGLSGRPAPAITRDDLDRLQNQFPDS